MKHEAYNINKIIEAIKKAGLVICPSDTVYGLLCDATNEEAVKKLIAFKNRPPGKPISVFVADFKMMKDYVDVNEKQMSLLKQLLPGPLTVVLKSKHRVSKLLESEKGTLGVRIPQHQLINKLIHEFGRPVTATSANLSGRSPHYQVETLLKQLPASKKKLIDLIIDKGKLPRNKPSTVIDLIDSNLKIIRHGDVVFKNTKTFISNSVIQTKQLGKYIINKSLNQINNKPLVMIIEGDLGVGKTVFIKGAGESLGINNIVSPTFVIYYEYQTKNPQVKNFYHFDLYQIQEKEEFKYLGIEKLLKPGNVLCFEWGEKAGEIINILRSKATVIYIKMKYISEKEREIICEF